MRAMLLAAAALAGMVGMLHAQPLAERPAPSSDATYALNGYDRFSVGCKTIDGHEQVNLNELAGRLPKPNVREIDAYFAERDCALVWREIAGWFLHIRTEGRFSLMRSVNGKWPDLYFLTSDFQGDLLNSAFVKPKRQ